MQIATKQLKKRIAKRETEAFVELYDSHGDALLRYLTSRVGPADARDVLQNVFTRLFRYHKQLAKAGNLTAYIFLTARNEANRFFAKSKVSTQRLDQQFEAVDERATVGELLETQEAATKLLGRLKPKVQEIVRLKIFSGLTFKEVGEIVGVPEQTAATNYRRAIEKLREISGVPKKVLPVNRPVEDRAK